MGEEQCSSNVLTSYFLERAECVEDVCVGGGVVCVCACVSTCVSVRACVCICALGNVCVFIKIHVCNIVAHALKTSKNCFGKSDDKEWGFSTIHSAIHVSQRREHKEGYCEGNIPGTPRPIETCWNFKFCSDWSEVLIEIL